MLTVLTLSNKFIMSHRDTQMTTMCILTLWFTWSSSEKYGERIFH